MAKFASLAGKSGVAKDLGESLDDILVKRQVLEAKLFKASDKVADINRRTHPADYDRARAVVGDLKQQIDQVAREHAAMAMAFTTAAGGRLISGPVTG